MSEMSLTSDIMIGNFTNIPPRIAAPRTFNNNFGVDRLLIGKVANLSLYNRALSATDVLQNYNAQKGRFGL